MRLSLSTELFPCADRGRNHSVDRVNKVCIHDPLVLYHTLNIFATTYSGDCISRCFSTLVSRTSDLTLGALFSQCTGGTVALVGLLIQDYVGEDVLRMSFARPTVKL